MQVGALITLSWLLFYSIGYFGYVDCQLLKNKTISKIPQI